MIRIDTFSGGVGTMRGKGDPMKVLSVLDRDPWVSCFDESESPALHKSLNALVRSGMVLLERKGYPWTKAIITDAGRARIDAARGGK